MASPPATPAPFIRHPSLSPSDDSSIIELSFDYEFDSAGNYVRVSKGGSRSNHSSPPTPQDIHSASPVNGVTRAKSAVIASSPVLLTSPARRASLSRSESYPVMSIADQRAQAQQQLEKNQELQAPPSTTSRSFQRVVSGPTLSSNPTAPTSTSSLRTGAPLSNGLRGTSRKLSARPQLAALGPQRVTIEQYREMDEKIRLEDEEMRVHGVGVTAREEKENLSDIVEGVGDVNIPHYHQPHQTKQQRSSPRLSARPASISHMPSEGHNRITSGLPSRTSSLTSASTTSTATAATSASSGRQILPGPSRAGRILMGAKYTNTASASALNSAVAPGPGGFDRINEMDALDNEVGGVGGSGGVLDFYSVEDANTGLDELQPQPTAKHRNHVVPSISNAPSASVAAAGLNQSGNTRPRRSASLSDAGADDRLSPHRPPSSALSNHYMNRPGSSLGFSGNGNGTAAGISGSGSGSGAIRARRVTIEEKYRQEREREAELEEYERQLAEDAAAAAEAERRILEDNEQQQPPPPQQQQQQRKSPSPTHLSLASHSQHLRPSAYGHKRRDSDTLRNLPNTVSTQSNLGPSSSPTVVNHGYSTGNVNGQGPHKLSPPTRSFPSSVLSKGQQGHGHGHSHKRSPTAPEVSMTSGMVGGSGSSVGVGQTWAVGDEDEFGEQERERGKSVERERERGKEAARNAPSRQQPPRPTSAPAPPPTQAAAAGPVPVTGRQLFVNKKVYVRLDMIGKGGSSRVYRVMTMANEIYAIKRVSLDKTDADTMSGYMNEIALLKRLSGNNRIIQLVDSELRAGPGGNKGHLLLVMECGEIDLSRLLQEQQKEPMNMVWISYYWQQMLQAVHVIHEEKIVHSDLKPANFVLVRGQLKLIDFGIANAIANDTTNIQRDHQIGTVNYMSPEAIELPDGMRRLKVGRPSDVWSLGCILYQMVYGHPPFQHLSVFQKMKAIPDLTHIIDFPRYSTPSIPTRTSGSTTPPKKLDHLKMRVRGDVIMSMKSCLCRNPKERAAIPELLDQDWLAMKESEPPAAKPSLKHDETIINPYYMRQLLSYGIKLGQQTQHTDMDPDELLKEAERLVAELKALES